MDTEKELRRMNRAELIEIIYTLKSGEEQQAEEIEALKHKLEDRRIRINEAGSIADAAMSLNDVFAAAQSAANDYLESIRDATAETEERKQEMIEEAKKSAEEILSNAQKTADDTIAAARAQVEEALAAAQAEVDEMKAQNEELMKAQALKTRQQCKGLLARAKKQSEESNRRREAVDQEVDAKWQVFQERCAAYIEASDALRLFFQQSTGGAE